MGIERTVVPTGRFSRGTGSPAGSRTPGGHFASGVRYPDVAIEDIKLAIEVDGREHHSRETTSRTTASATTSSSRRAGPCCTFTWRQLTQRSRGHDHDHSGHRRPAPGARYGSRRPSTAPRCGRLRPFRADCRPAQCVQSHQPQRALAGSVAGRRGRPEAGATRRALARLVGVDRVLPERALQPGQPVPEGRGVRAEVRGGGLDQPGERGDQRAGLVQVTVRGPVGVRRRRGPAARRRRSSAAPRPG